MQSSNYNEGQPTSALRLFCSITSIRGMSKIHRGPRFLRVLWLCFVVLMISLLFTATIFLVSDYNLYDVGIHTKVVMDCESNFPALTVCHHHPFSLTAYQLWRSGKVRSPSQFNRQMRDFQTKMIVSGNLESATGLFVFDTLDIYYQSLRYEEAFELGHTPSIFKNCYRRLSSQHINFEDDCTRLENYTIRRFSHPRYFNCHIFQPANEEIATKVEFLSIIVSLGPKPDYKKFEQAFFLDIFEKAMGLRVAVHEMDTYPELEKEGLHVEPGKLNEINYQPVSWKRLSTKVRPCIHANETESFRDMDVSFKYTHSQCLLYHQQIAINRKCNCVYFLNPRPNIPNGTLQYCGNVPMTDMKSFEEHWAKIDCLANYLRPEVKRKFDGKECLPRCEYYQYESTISITKWQATEWQLHWLKLQNQMLKEFTEESYRYPTPKNYTEYETFRKWNTYLANNDLTNVLTTPGNSVNDLDLEGDNFAYIVLKRKTSDCVHKKEKLILTQYVLLSRVGGLASLFVGLTAAFVIEVIEFLYLYIESRTTGGASSGAAGALYAAAAAPSDGGEATRLHLNSPPTPTPLSSRADAARPPNGLLISSGDFDSSRSPPYLDEDFDAYRTAATFHELQLLRDREQFL